jgi:hypothetical protein
VFFMGQLDELAWQDMADYGFPGVRVQTVEVGGRPRIVGIQIQRPEGLEDGDVPIRLLENALAFRGTGIDFGRPPTRRDLRVPQRLRVPEGRRLSDDFYQRVADLYSWCARWSVAPAPALAAANENVPVSTVHAWIKEARRRGLLAPARKQGSTG